MHEQELPIDLDHLRTVAMQLHVILPSFTAMPVALIADVGGITIAQRPDTAVVPEMPLSAIQSGCIDFILAPEEIATEITRIERVGSPAE